MSAIDAPVATGKVLQVNVSNGGVPKLPVERAWVGPLGLDGDGHTDRTEHGGPHRAVCLYAIEAIERLQAEGHPVEPGSVGENLTTSGIEWSLLPIGTIARVGSDLVLELASSTTPCATQKPNFRDGKYSRILIDNHPADSRMYARVVYEGEVRPGDRITIHAPMPDSRAVDLQTLKRLDRAEAKSTVAAWRAAADAGFDVRVAEDGEIAMAAAPEIAGPGFNHAVGFTQLPHLVSLATDFYDEHQTAGWIISDSPPWPGAESRLVVGVFAAAVRDVPVVGLPDGIELRHATPDDGPAVEAVYEAAEATGISERATVNPWPRVYSRLAAHPHRVIFVAQMGEPIVGVASMHTHARTGWLRGAAVTPQARGQGIQRALISARVELARELGCDLVGAWAEPGKQSASNLRQMGLRQIGTREHFVYKPRSAAQ